MQQVGLGDIRSMPVFGDESPRRRTAGVRPSMEAARR